jgi:Uma2 family endonuclease
MQAMTVLDAPPKPAQPTPPTRPKPAASPPPAGGYSLRPTIGVDAGVTPPDGEPVWQLAEMLYPSQGRWTREQYLALDTNQLVEFVEGRLEFLPVPTFFHQDIVAHIYHLLYDLVRRQNLGRVYFAPLRVRTLPERIREPDISVILGPRRTDPRAQPVPRIDLAVEVVSPTGEQRDYQVKRAEYAAAGFREYWIVDPQERHIVVLALEGEQYVEVGTFRDDEPAAGRLIDGFSVKPSDVWAAGEA